MQRNYQLSRRVSGGCEGRQADLAVWIWGDKRRVIRLVGLVDAIAEETKAKDLW